MTVGFAIFLLVMGAAIGAAINIAWNDYLEGRRDLISVRRHKQARESEVWAGWRRPIFDPDEVRPGRGV